MGIYDYLNSNNGQTADLSYNTEAKSLIDNLLSGNIDVTSAPIRGNSQATNVNGYRNFAYQPNTYSVRVPDPQSNGYFFVDAKVDPNTGKATNLGATYSSNGNQYTSFYAPLAVAASIIAPVLAPELAAAFFGAEAGTMIAGDAVLAGAEAGTTIAGDAFLPGALATDSAVAPSIAADIASQAPTVASAVAPDVVSTLSSVAPDVVNTPAQQALDNLIAQQQTLYPTIGDTTVGLPQVGSSTLEGAGKGALTSAIADVAQGKPLTVEDIAKGAILGGVGGATGNLASQFGADTITKGVASGITSGATGALLNNGDVTKSALTGALTGGISGATSDLLAGQDPSAIAAGKSISSGLTNAVLSGNTNNLGANLVTGALGSAGLTAINNAIPPLSSFLPTQDTSTQVASADTPANQDTAINHALVNAFQNPYDTSQYPTYAPLASNGTVTMSDIGSSSPLVPVQNTLSNTPTDLTAKQQYDELVNNQGMDSKTASEMSGYTPSSSDTIDLNILSTPQPSSPLSSVPETTTQPSVPQTIPQSSSPLSSVPQTTTQPSVTASPLSQPTIDLTPIDNQISNLDSGLQKTNELLKNASTQEQSDFSKLSSQQQQQAIDIANQGTSLGNAIGAVNTNLNNQIGGLNTGLNALSGTVNGLGTGLNNLSGTVNGLGNSLNTTNQNITDVGNQVTNLDKTVTQNQSTTQQALNNLSDAQKEEVATQIAQGISLNSAIKNVQKNVQSDVSNLQGNVNALQTSVNNTNAKNDATLRNKQLAPTSLYTGDVLKNTDILQTLKQLDPQLLSKIAPHLSSQQSMPQNAVSPSSHQSTPYNGLMSAMLGGQEHANNLMSAGNSLINGGALPGYKSGGQVLENAPVFITGETGHYVKGRGDGQSDDIPAMLADGEYVFDADTVAQLGNGSSDAGAKLLDHFREALREHKRSAPTDKIPPMASPLTYMKEALKRHKKG